MVLYVGYKRVCPVIKLKDGSASKYGFTVDNFLGNVDENWKLQLPGDTTSDIVFTGFKDVENSALSYKFYKNTNLTHGVVFQDLEKISGDYGCAYMFYNCTGLTSASFPNLTTIGDYGCHSMLYTCAGLTSASLPNLTTIGYHGCHSMFYNCIRLTSASFPNLTTIGDYGCHSMLYYCMELTSVSLQNLTTIGNYGCNSMFHGCSNIEHIYFNSLITSSFGSYKNQFSNMMSSTGTSKIHTIHFPSNLESKIQTLTGYPNFGGTSGYVVLAFDLPATN